MIFGDRYDKFFKTNCASFFLPLMMSTHYGHKLIVSDDKSKAKSTENIRISHQLSQFYSKIAQKSQLDISTKLIK